MFAARRREWRPLDDPSMSRPQSWKPRGTGLTNLGDEIDDNAVPPAQGQTEPQTVQKPWYSSCLYGKVLFTFTVPDVLAIGTTSSADLTGLVARSSLSRSRRRVLRASTQRTWGGPDG